MNVLYEKSFSRDIDRLKHEKAIKKHLLELIEKIKKSSSLADLSSIKKIEGYKAYYRIRIGDYRLGIKVSENTIILIRFLHRREIYRKFP